MADNDRPVVVTTGGGGAGWFIVGGLVVLALVAVFLYGGDFLDRGTTASIPSDINVNVDLPKVDKPAQ